MSTSKSDAKSAPPLRNRDQRRALTGLIGEPAVDVVPRAPVGVHRARQHEVLPHSVPRRGAVGGVAVMLNNPTSLTDWLTMLRLLNPVVM